MHDLESEASRCNPYNATRRGRLLCVKCRWCVSFVCGGGVSDAAEMRKELNKEIRGRAQVHSRGARARSRARPRACSSASRTFPLDGRRSAAMRSCSRKVAGETFAWEAPFPAQTRRATAPIRLVKSKASPRATRSVAFRTGPSPATAAYTTSHCKQWAIASGTGAPLGRTLPNGHGSGRESCMRLVVVQSFTVRGAARR